MNWLEALCLLKPKELFIDATSKEIAHISKGCDFVYKRKIEYDAKIVLVLKNRFR